MERSTFLGIAGLVVLVAGLVLIARADSLATQWQPLGDGAWGGTTDPAQRTSLRQMGLVISVMGTVFVALAARRWVSVKPTDLPPVDTEPPVTS